MSTATFHSVVYGPVKSRRLGTSLGVNPVPSSREGCDATCIICQRGSSDAVPILSRAGQLPSAGVIVTSAARRIIEMSRAGEKLESVTVVGNGDPTRHTSLLQITENLRDLRNKWFPKADLAVISDSNNLASEEIRRGLRIYDGPILRFEWGTLKTFTAMTERPAAEYKSICEALTALDRLVVQASFGPLNSTDVELKAWMKKVEELRPKEVQLLAPDGGKKAKVKGLSASKLEELAESFTEKTGIPAQVFSRETQPV
jgi:wyosine [tRNA(Phe)-imidazoG37] synthetase (radical SAM superfamily)